MRQVGLEGNLNNELVISMQPGVLMTMTNPDAAFGEYKTLIDAGIPVLPNADWLETTPLGKAEWVKLMGALTDREELVNRKFDSVEHAYQRLAAIGNAAAVRPSVIIGMPFKGTWYTPAGGSYMAQFLRDAGATYHWSDTKGTGSLALTFETVAPVALTADFWLDVGDVNSKKEILSQDPRYGAFRSFRSDAIYNYNRRVNDAGASDYWESGAVNPQWVLADLIRILHPDALPAGYADLLQTNQMTATPFQEVRLTGLLLLLLLAFLLDLSTGTVNISFKEILRVFFSPSATADIRSGQVHRLTDPAAQSLYRGAGGMRPLRRRASDANPVPKPARRPLHPGHYCRRQPGSRRRYAGWRKHGHAVCHQIAGRFRQLADHRRGLYRRRCGHGARADPFPSA